MIGFNEKRRHQRVDVRIPLKFKELRTKDPSGRGALAKNISEGGVRFNIDRFISLSCRLVVEISLPTVSKPLRAISKIAWIKKLPAGDDYEVGNQFLEMTKEDRNIVADFIKKSTTQPYSNADQV